MASTTDDPTYAAYLKALGFPSAAPAATAPDPAAQAQANAARLSGQAQAAYNLQAPEMEHQGVLQRQNIDYGFEDRGLGSSGMRLEALDEQKRRQKYEQDLAAMGLHNDLANIQASLAAQLAAMNAAASTGNIGGLYGQYGGAPNQQTGGGSSGIFRS